MERMRQDEPVNVQVNNGFSKQVILLKNKRIIQLI